MKENENDDLVLDLTNFDFTVNDRFAEHLAENAQDENSDIELPEWHGTSDPIEDLYSNETLIKALKLLRGGKVTLVEGKANLYEIVGSDLYVANVIDLPESKVPGVTCTCPNGQARGGRPTCYHSAAALLEHMNVDLKYFEESVIY